MTKNDSRSQAQAKNSTVRRFIEAVHDLEENNKLEPMLAMYGEGCTLCNVQLDKVLEGQEGAQLYWHDYRHTFDNITSRFTRITETDKVGVLEWVSTGTLKTGHPINYKGVSVLELEGDKVADFMAYFDTHPFTVHM